MIELVIPRATPSLNQTQYKHWSVYRRLKMLWRKEIWAARIQTKAKFVIPPARARVKITRSGRLLDHDNYIGGLKCILDCLRTDGLIRDDNAEHLELIATQQVGEPKTIIQIEEFLE